MTRERDHIARERERTTERVGEREREREIERERESWGGGDLLTTFGWGEGGDLLTTFGHVWVGRVNDFGAGFAVPTDKIKNVPLLIVWE